MKLLQLYRGNPKEFWRIFRYLLVGGWNTLFGVGIYTLLYWWLGKEVNYLVLAIPANILSITNAFLCYKFIVFRTRGNFWLEYLKCYIVYGTSMLISAGLLFAAVTGCKLNPVIANFIITLLMVAVSYLGHKFFSFRKSGR